MHTAVDFLFRQCDFELTRKESLRANLTKWLVEFLVTCGLEGDDLALQSARLQRSCDNSRLPKRQLRRSRSDPDRAVLHSKARTTAETNPSIVDSFASASNSIPASVTASVVC